MSDMIERAMKAIQQLGCVDVANYRHRELIVRAVLEAMREPTLSMVHAGAWAGPFTIDRYTAMISAALSQDTPSLPLKPQEAVKPAVETPQAPAAGTNSEVQR